MNMNLPKWAVIGIFILGMTADLLQVFGNSYVLSLLSSAFSRFLPLFVFFLFVSLTFAAFYYRKKYTSITANLERMSKSVFDLLSPRFVRKDIIAERFRARYTILNEAGDSKINISWRLKAAGKVPFHYMESFIAFDEGDNGKDDFLKSLKIQGATLDPVDEIRVQNYDVFIYRLVFSKAIDDKQFYECGMTFSLKGIFPLSKKDNDIGSQIAMPTMSTGCILELPSPWKVEHRRAEHHDLSSSPQVLPDENFHQTENEGFEWSLDNPKHRSVYHVYFTARK